MKTCEKCRFNNEDTAMFCIECGCKLPEAEPVKTTTKLVCPKCESENLKDAKVCIICGYVFEKETSPKPEQKNGTQCPSCGYENPGRVKFCIRCGHNVAEQAEQQQQSNNGNVVCSDCGYENPDRVKYCIRCGKDMNAPAGVLKSERINTYTSGYRSSYGADTSIDTEKTIPVISKKTPDKKFIIRISSIVAAVVILVLVLSRVLPYAPHYFKGNSAMKAQDYTTAISEYGLAKSFLNTESKLDNAYYMYAETLYSEEKFHDAAKQYNLIKGYKDAEAKIILCGRNLLDDEIYIRALEVFEMVDTEEVAEMKSYASGMYNFNSSEYLNAKSDFYKAGDYKDSKRMFDASNFMMAEEYCKENKFMSAKAIYTDLPEGFTYNGISAKDRLDLINNSQDVIDALGTWNVSENYIETKNVEKRTGSWTSWYLEKADALPLQNITVKCALSSDNTFIISGTVTFYKFDSYSEIKENCLPEIVSESFSMTGVTEIPASHTINDYTTLYFSDGVFTVKYSERDDYSASHYNLYNSSVTYGKLG